MIKAHTCPVCGYPYLVEPPYSSSGGGSAEFCPCCDFQFGVTDEDEGWTIPSWRRRWIDMGMPWDPLTGEAPPPGWDPVAQLASIQPGEVNR